jgi:hypothetical protein
MCCVHLHVVNRWLLQLTEMNAYSNDIKYSKFVTPLARCQLLQRLNVGYNDLDDGDLSEKRWQSQLQSMFSQNGSRCMITTQPDFSGT